MTERATKTAERPRSRRGPDKAVIWLLALSAFLLLLAFLSFQTRPSGAPTSNVGSNAATGNVGSNAATGNVGSKRQLAPLRRVYETRVVEGVRATVPEGASTSQSSPRVTQSSPGVTQATPAPTTRTS